MGFRGKIAVLRYLEGFLEKSEESRTPLKLKIIRGLLNTFVAFWKCLKLAPENG